ncbi:MAG: Ldh family oxidoreductase [Betaproteobacteria bacterium]|nr:Ldh family oxidoreductase [Betaproteobacteria bacterium]
MSTSARSLLASSQALKEFAGNCFIASGCVAEHAATVADNLVLADLRGIDSHGVTRVPIYVERLLRGAVAPRPELRIERQEGGCAVVDGGNGPGAVVSCFANSVAIDLARSNGIGFAATRRSNHNGIASYYTVQTARRGMIGMSATNAARSLVVWGARESALGANPMSYAVPAGKYDAIVLDMSSTVVARGKIVERAKRGETIPEGWAIDRHGRPTTDAREGEAGFVLPFAGPKGSGFAMIVDILGGVLSGANYGRLIPNLYHDFENAQNIGHCFMAIDITRFMPLDAFIARMEDMIAALKSATRAEGVGEILMPGEPERRTELLRRAEGIPLPANVVEDLRETAERLRVPLPEFVPARFRKGE